jgi:hypothetical protein
MYEKEEEEESRAVVQNGWNSVPEKKTPLAVLCDHFKSWISHILTSYQRSFIFMFLLQ